MLFHQVDTLLKGFEILFQIMLMHYELDVKIGFAFATHFFIGNSSWSVVLHHSMGFSNWLFDTFGRALIFKKIMLVSSEMFLSKIHASKKTNSKAFFMQCFFKHD